MHLLPDGAGIPRPACPGRHSSLMIQSGSRGVFCWADCVIVPPSFIGARWQGAEGRASASDTTEGVLEKVGNILKRHKKSFCW